MGAKATLISGFLALSAIGAQAQFVTYAQWQQLSPNSRAAYMAGSIDSLAVFWRQPAPDVVDEVWKCLTKMNLHPTQLAENVKAYADPKPELHAGTVQNAMMLYLKAACLP